MNLITEIFVQDNRGVEPLIKKVPDRCFGELGYIGFLG